MSKTIKNIVLIFTLLLIFTGTNSIYGQSREYRLKGGFIAKFTKFTDWPQNSNKTFNIIVYGSSDIVAEYQEVFRDLKVKNKDVKVIRYKSLKPDTHIDIIYISNNQKNLFPEIYKAHMEKPVLIISESPGLAKKGAHINFYLTQDETLHFEINEETVNKSNLKMNFRLLEIAKIVSLAK